ncbi:MAG: 3'-5' exonuclease [Candidatus Cybelea sp.]|jgi:DNA polymerase III epsilon subunit family exonuclease
MEVERYAVVDVETTGFSPTRDHVVEIGCVLIDGDAVVYRWGTLVNPGIAIPEHATAIHGITDKMVATAPDLGAALTQLRKLCGRRTIAAHSAPFDLSFLGPAFATQALCTMRLARAVFPEAPNHKNQTLRKYLSIDDAIGEDLGTHRALDDAIVTAHILIACRRRVLAGSPSQSWERFTRTRATVTLSSKCAA